MTPEETIALCERVSAYCPSQRFNEYTPDAWYDVLSDVDYRDACIVARELARTQPRDGGTRYIEPAAIIAGVRKLRRERVEAHPIPDPPPGIGDNPAAYQAWLRDTTARIAAGEQLPELPANPAGQARYRQLAAGVGRSIE